MHRFSLTTRIGLIVSVGMLVLWFRLIALADWSNDLAPSADLPRSARIAALANLIERTPAPDRAAPLQIINAAINHQRRNDQGPAYSRAGSEADHAKSAPYGAALGDR